MDDFHKYRPAVDPACLDAVFLGVARSMGGQIKYSRLNEQHSYHTSHKAFDLLAKARLVRRIHSCNPPEVPLGAFVNPKRFKACLLDIGLFQRLCRVPVETEFRRFDLLKIYQGRLAEQFVAQEILAWHSEELYYWAREARGSSAEVDFLTMKDGRVCPIEVKSGPGGALKSLHMLLNDHSDWPGGIVLYSGTYIDLPDQRLTFMPLFCTPLVGAAGI